GISLLSFDVIRSITIPIPCIPFVTPCTVDIPVGFNLFRAGAGIGNDASSETIGGIPVINPNKPDLRGFLEIDDRINSPRPLVSPTGPAAAAREYVPLITAMERGFRGANASVELNLDPLAFSAIFPFDIAVHVTVTGSLVFDIWSSANTDFTTPDIPLIGAI